MKAPLIGVTGRRWPASALGEALPKAMAAVEFDLHFSDYTRQIAAAGGIPVELSRDADVVAVIDRLDGVVLSAGADIDPSFYDQPPDAKLGDVEPERDAWELEILAKTYEANKPILAICRGFQLLNVHFGGTLRQHIGLEDGVGHPRFDESGHQRTHGVTCTSGTITHSLYGAELRVNSLHHQCADVIGGGLIVSARATDGVVEGLETTDQTVLALQWHPELLDVPDPSFVWLVRTASA